MLNLTPSREKLSRGAPGGRSFGPFWGEVLGAEGGEPARGTELGGQSGGNVPLSGGTGGRGTAVLQAEPVDRLACLDSPFPEPPGSRGQLRDREATEGKDGHTCVPWGVVTAMIRDSVT